LPIGYEIQPISLQLGQASSELGFISTMFLKEPEDCPGKMRFMARRLVLRWPFCFRVCLDSAPSGFAKLNLAGLRRSSSFQPDEQWPPSQAAACSGPQVK